MAVKGNDPNERVVQDLRLYTGIVAAKVIAVNPSLEQLNAIGIPFQNPIEYVDKTQDDTERVRLDFWLHCFNKGATDDDKVDIKTKLSFFIQRKSRYSENKKTFEFINNFGQTTWAPSKDEITSEKFKRQGVRNAMDGEDFLVNFIINWINAKRDDEVFLETWPAIFKGDYKELQEIAKTYRDHPVRVMLTVTEREGKFYQSVYNRYFARAYNVSTLPWSRYVHDNGGANAPRDKWSFELKMFNPSAAPAPDAIPEASQEVKDNAAGW